VTVTLFEYVTIHHPHPRCLSQSMCMTFH